VRFFYLKKTLTIQNNSICKKKKQQLFTGREKKKIYFINTEDTEKLGISSKREKYQEQAP